MKVAAIVDTNVILDIFAINDLMSSGDNPSAQHFRRMRSRDAHLLAWSFHQRRATTISLPNEVIRLASRLVPPGERRTVEYQYLQLSIYLLKDRVFRDWDMRIDDVDAGVSGNRSDQLLVELAQKYGVPLITNEGLTPRGIEDSEGLRARALRARIRVLTPRQAWERHQGERSARHLLRRYEREARKFASRNGNPSAAAHAVQLREGILRHILFGETSTGSRVPVFPPWWTDR